MFTAGLKLLQKMLVAALACGCTPYSLPSVDAATFLAASESRVDLSGPEGGTTFYVAPGGSDRGRGKAEEPFATISRAARAARPGDTVVVRPGRYPGPVEISANGQEGRPIRFMPESDGTVVIDGAGMPSDKDLVRISGKHIVFEGFRVVNATRSGISLWGTRDITVSGNEVSGSTRFGIVAGASELGQSSDVLVEGNILFDNVLENVSRTTEEGWARAIAIDVTDDAVVRSNIVFGNHGEGIGLLSSRNALVEGNVVYDNFSVNIYLDNAPEAEVRDNFVFTTHDSRFFRHGRPAFGLVIANERTKYQMPSRGIEIRDNTLVGVGRPFYSSYGANSGLRDSNIDDNDIFGSLTEVPHLVQDLPDGRPRRVDGRRRSPPLRRGRARTQTESSR